MRTTWIAVAVVSSLVASLLVGGAPASAQTDAVSVLSLGDSYVSGNGAGGYVGDADCYRTPNAWPVVYARELAQNGTSATAHHFACSGATIDDLDGQIQAAMAVGVNPDVVVVSIGGNDLGFSDIVADCFVILLAPFRCPDRIESSSALIAATIDETRTTLQRLARDFPSAHTVVLVGYPDLNSPLCVIPNSSEVRALQADYEQRQIGVAQSVDATVGTETRVEFVSLRTLYDGRGPCAFRSIVGDSAGRWVRQIGEGLPAEWFHPTEQGHAATGQMLAAMELHVPPAVAPTPTTTSTPTTTTTTSVPTTTTTTSTTAPVAMVPTCDGHEATIVGTDGADVLDGTPGADVIVGLGGADLIRGFGGADVICGGDGSDRIIAGSGADLVFGGAGDDVVRAGSGPDVVRGGDGLDELFGGNGRDTLIGEAGRDRLFGGGGRDTLAGGRGNDRLRGGPGVDTLDGGPGTRDNCNPERTVTRCST